MSETTKNIHQRILAVMAEFDYIEKGKKQVNSQYRYVSHDQVTGMLHPYLVKHGITAIPSVKSLTQDGNRTAICLEVELVNVDNPVDFVRIESWGYGIDTSDKGPGKGISYAFKYAMLKAFMLETGDDPDHDQDSKYEAPAQPQPEVKKASPKPNKGVSESFDFSFLKQLLKDDGLSVARLEEWVAMRGAMKGMSPEETVKVCTQTHVYPSVREAFKNWLGANPEPATNH